MSSPTAVLSASQLALLAEQGEERRAEVGGVLGRVGDCGGRGAMVVRFVHDRIARDPPAAPAAAKLG